jgi:hypothetical protein
MPRSANFYPLATSFMKQDFLSPTLAMMLFPELCGRPGGCGIGAES